MSTQTNGLIIDRIEDEFGNDVSNTDEWSCHELTIHFTNGCRFEVSKGNGLINIDLKGVIDGDL
jgi:hypothetical protein